MNASPKNADLEARKRARKSRRKQRAAAGLQDLPAFRPHAAGIDLASTEHWVCCPAKPGAKPNVRTFGTTTPELTQLVDWLQQEGIETVAMESTHVYWIPLYELLESRGIEACLVNARQMHHVPGRKTDMQDCQWLQLLHSRGLLRGSFRPAEAITRLRALHRQLGNLVAERTRFVQWIQQALDQMNVQVHRAVSDLTGETGMRIVRAIVAGERDPRKLVALRHKRCHKSEAEFVAYLTGTWRDAHLFNLQASLRLYDTVQESIADYERQLLEELEALEALWPEERREEPVPPHPNPKKEQAMRSKGQLDERAALWRVTGVDLTRIDGISTGAARTILTEAGPDLSAFPDERHFASWLRLTPRTAVSGGKPLRGKKNGTGSTRIAGVLRMAAVSLQHSDSALGAAFRRTARRKGYTVAVFAIARKLAHLVYRALRYGQEYVDIGAELYEQQYHKQAVSNLKARADNLGYNLVPLSPAAAA